jgi:hypothetical protein
MHKLDQQSQKCSRSAGKTLSCAWWLGVTKDRDRFATGHDFSRADQVSPIDRALAPALSQLISRHLCRHNVPCAAWLTVSAALLVMALPLLSVLLMAVLAPPAYCLRSDLSASAGSAGSREFFDPCLRSHWQLQTNPAHPEQPGRLVLVNPNGAHPGQPARAPGELVSPTSHFVEGRINPAHAASPPIIRAGDRVIVNQQTRVLHAHLSAIALESATPGQRIRVRLAAGTPSARVLDATIITVLATAPGQAQWPTDEGTRP